jgi:CcmD family protein
MKRTARLLAARSLTALTLTLLTLTLLTLTVAAVAPALAQQPLPPRQEVYVPVDSLPQQEQIAAAPLLVGAYSFVLVAFFVYLVSVARRMQGVQREIERLERDLKKPGLG